MDRSVYIMKPDGMPHLDEVHEMLLSAGLRIVASRFVCLPGWVVAFLYPKVTGEWRRFIVERMTGTPVEIGIVEGEDAIAKLCCVTGEATDPRRCARGTIRQRFGNPLPDALILSTGTSSIAPVPSRSRNGICRS